MNDIKLCNDGAFTSPLHSPKANTSYKDGQQNTKGTDHHNYNKRSSWSWNKFIKNM